MTAPTITYGHGAFTDCDDGSIWTFSQGYNISGTSKTIEHNDILKLGATFDDSGNEFAVWDYDITNISSDTYSKIIVRWKTSVSSNGGGARVQLQFSDATTQYIVGETNPEFSTTWKVTTATITSGKTIDKIRVWIDDYPDSVASGTDYVYIDFIMICKGIFTFPQCDEVSMDLTNVYADLTAPTRVGDITQYLAMNSPIIRLTGKIDVDTSNWGSPYGEYLYYIWREACSDPWQWFTSDLINCKVTPRTFHISQNSDSKALRVWSCELRKYDKSSGAETTWSGKQYYGFES